MAFYLVPWNALFAEFSDDYAERTAIVTFRYLVGWIGGVVFTFCTWTLHLPEHRRVCERATEPGGLSPISRRSSACSSPLAAFITTHLTRNEIPYLLQPTGSPSPFSLKRVLAEVLLALRNRDFLVLFMTLLTSSAIGGTIEALNIYCRRISGSCDGEACAG